VILVGLQTEATNDRNSDEFIEGSEKTEWETIRFDVDRFLAETKLSIRQWMEEMLEAYRIIGINMLHFLLFHLDFFPINLGDISDKCGERFHRDISTMEKRYQRKLNLILMGDYCCKLKREVPDVLYRCGNQVERNSEHIKCKCILHISIT
jgi:hypothetical protein